MHSNLKTNKACCGRWTAILMTGALVGLTSLGTAGAQEWPRVAPSLPKPVGAVVRVTTVDQFTAAVDALKTGQTILLAPGVYKMPRSITIEGVNKVAVRGDSRDRAKVVLDFSESTHTEGVRFQRCRDVILADLTVQNVSQNGIKIDGDLQAEKVTIHNVVSRNVWQRHVKGPKVPSGPNGKPDYSRGHRIQYCLFENDRPKRIGDDPYEDRDPRIFGHNYLGGIDMMNADGLVIADSVFRNLHGKTHEGRGAVFLWINSKDCIVERNLFLDCDQGVCLGNGSGLDEPMHATGCIVRNNFIVRCPEGNLFTAHTKDCRILNNTVHDPDGRRLFRAIADNQDLVVAGNIFSGPPIPRESMGGGIVLRDNLNRPLAEYFRDPAKGDLHLLAAAKDAIDRGLTEPLVPGDIDGTKRVSPSDLGADEWEGK